MAAKKKSAKKATKKATRKTAKKAPARATKKKSAKKLPRREAVTKGPAMTPQLRLWSELTYPKALTDSGFLQGPFGDLSIHPRVKPLLDAIQHVLAGGEAAVTITREGTPEEVKRLDAELAETLKRISEYNQTRPGDIQPFT